MNLCLLLSLFIYLSAFAKENCSGTTEQEDPIFEKFCKNPESVICDKSNFKDSTKHTTAISLKPFKELVLEHSSTFKLNGNDSIDSNQFFNLSQEVFKSCSSPDENLFVCEEDELEKVYENIYGSYIANKDQFKTFKEKLLLEYFQRQQQHLNNIVESKEDYLVDIFQSAVNKFSENINTMLSKQYSGKRREEKIKQAFSLLNRIKPLFALTPKAEKRFNDSYNFARDGFVRSCTHYGIYGGAFVPGLKLSKLPNSIPVTFCPSFMAEVYGDEKIHENRDEIYFKMLMVITHELGHLFGPEKLMTFSPARATETILCMSKHYPGAWYTKGLIIDYKDEIMADIFAAKTVTSELLNRNFSKIKKLRLLSSSYKLLCGSEDDGSHPSGTFRLNEILLREPGIFKMFGCKKFYPKQSLYSCSGIGAKALNNVEL